MARKAASAVPRKGRFSAISSFRRSTAPAPPPLPFVCMHIVCIHIVRASMGQATERAERMRNIWLGLALVPYLAAVGVDAWMHERSRRVPRVEQWIHAGLALAMAVFLGAVFAGRAAPAVAALAI